MFTDRRMMSPDQCDQCLRNIGLSEKDSIDVVTSLLSAVKSLPMGSRVSLAIMYCQFETNQNLQGQVVFWAVNNEAIAVFDNLFPESQ